MSGYVGGAPASPHGVPVQHPGPFAECMTGAVVDPVAGEVADPTAAATGSTNTAAARTVPRTTLPRLIIGTA
jgi:hypothetical protein